MWLFFSEIANKKIKNCVFQKWMLCLRGRLGISLLEWQKTQNSAKHNEIAELYLASSIHEKKHLQKSKTTYTFVLKTKKQPYFYHCFFYPSENNFSRFDIPKYRIIFVLSFISKPPKRQNMEIKNKMHRFLIYCTIVVPMVIFMVASN